MGHRAIVVANNNNDRRRHPLQSQIHHIIKFNCIIGSNGILINFKWKKKKKEEEEERTEKRNGGRNGNVSCAMGVPSTDRVKHYMDFGYGRDLVCKVCFYPISICHDLYHFNWITIYRCVIIRCSSTPPIGSGLTISRSLATI